MTERNVKLIFAGDLVPSKLVDIKDVSSSEISDVLSQADLAMVNLECPLVDHSAFIAKIGPCLKALPSAARFARSLGFSVAALANNHILDQGHSGVIETIQHCQAAGLQTIGAGENLATAAKPLNVEIRGQKVAILNYCEREFSIARINSPGANPFDLINCLNDIQSVRTACEIIILVIHGGIEHYPLPSPERRRTYRFLAEQPGVSAIISHHTHCPSAYECWNKVPIYYGIGNFIFPQRNVMYSGWNEGYLVELSFVNGSCADSIIHPFIQNISNPVIKLLCGERKREFLSKLIILNEAVCNDQLFYMKWFEFLKRRKPYYFAYLKGFNRSVSFLFRKIPMLACFLPPRNPNQILNLIRCEAHREALTNILEMKY